MQAVTFGFNEQWIKRNYNRSIVQDQNQCYGRCECLHIHISIKLEVCIYLAAWTETETHTHTYALTLRPLKHLGI